MAAFTQQEQEKCREAFMRFDKDRNGTIDAHELRAALEAFGQKPSDEEIFIMCALGCSESPLLQRPSPSLCRPQPRAPSTTPSPGRRIAEVDVDANGVVDFAEFVRVLQAQKERAAALGSESDMVDAFIACGGQPDKSGFVERDRLVRIVKEDFGLTCVARACRRLKPCFSTLSCRPR
jgi:Ca2+-binding EF-hand superfamily protein